MELHETVMGKRFFEDTMPRIARSLERIASSLEKRKDACKRILPAGANCDLFALMAKYPDLPVIPMVTSSIVTDDSCTRWMANFGKAWVDEYIVGSERGFFRSEKDAYEVEQLVSDLKGYEVFEKMTAEEANAAYDAAPWKRAIIIDIHEPCD